jgi:hypothetical protein
MILSRLGLLVSSSQEMSVFSFIVLLPLNYSSGGHANGIDFQGYYFGNLFFTDFLRCTSHSQWPTNVQSSMSSPPVLVFLGGIDGCHQYIFAHAYLQPPRVKPAWITRHTSHVIVSLVCHAQVSPPDPVDLSFATTLCCPTTVALATSV